MIPGQIMWLQILSKEMMTVRILLQRRKYGVTKRKKVAVVVYDSRLIGLMASLSRDYPKFEDLRRKGMLRIPVMFRTGERPRVELAPERSAPNREIADAIMVHEVMAR